MRAVTAFAPTWEITDSAGPSSHGSGVRQRGRKRSRSVSSEADIDYDRSPTLDNPRRRSLSGNPKDQHYVAGHDIALPLPSPSFPHAAKADGRRTREVYDVEAAFATLHPPLRAPPPLRVREDSSQLRQHVGAMNAILHTSLLRGDYQRAGQVFALLLRVASGSVNLPIRANGHWGIGAEILLRKSGAVESRRRKRRGSDESSSGSDGGSDSDGARKATRLTIPSDNFAAVKSYYESLILQYPHSRFHPHAVDTRTFYPAYFSLCIHEAGTATEQALSRLSTERDIGRGTQDTDSSNSSDSDLQAERLEVKRAELEAAKDIATKMDEVLISPPFDRFVPLLRMRGHVARWTTDLASGQIEGEETDQSDQQQLKDLVTSERAKVTTMFERVAKYSGGDGRRPAKGSKRSD